MLSHTKTIYAAYETYTRTNQVIDMLSRYSL